MAHYSVFRQELAIAYPTYGSALWEPDPGGQYYAVEVGDVGFIRRGYFQRLFNVLLPKYHPSHRNPSFVPEDHQQLVTIPDHIVTNEIRTGSRQNSLHFCSQYVTLDSRGRGTSASGPEDDSQITFSCSGRQGALLSLPVTARGQDTVASGDFGKWMIKHIDTWFAFARGLGLGINRMEDLILVTGRHLTKSWVNVAFTQRRPDAGVSFDVQASGHGYDYNVSLEQEYVRGGDLKLGPTGKDLPGNQCIFIRGFRVARILGLWPKLRGQAGPAPDAGDQEPEPEPQLELINVPDDSNLQDPLQDLLQYVAEQAPDCDMALIHDNDLACMDVAPRIALQTHEFVDHLRKSAPTIQRFQCELPSGNKSEPGADVAIAKVATLSDHAFEAPRKGSDLNLILTAGGATDRSAPVASLPVVPSVPTSSRLDAAAYVLENKIIETRIGLLHEILGAVNDKISNMTLINEIEDLQPRQCKLQQWINTHFSQRYDLISRHRKDGTQYYATLDEDWYHYRAKWSAESKAEIDGQIDGQIDDCQTLIEYFSFVSRTTVTGKMPSSSSIDIPFYMRTTLISLSILPPSSPQDVPLVVRNLKTKKARLEEIARLREIARLEIAREEEIVWLEEIAREVDIAPEEIAREKKIVRLEEIEREEEMQLEMVRLKAMQLEMIQLDRISQLKGISQLERILELKTNSWLVRNSLFQAVAELGGIARLGKVTREKMIAQEEEIERLEKARLS